MKKVDGSTGYGGDWTLRIEADTVEALQDDGDEYQDLPERQISLIFYIANEDVRTFICKFMSTYR